MQRPRTCTSKTHVGLPSAGAYRVHLQSSRICKLRHRSACTYDAEEAVRSRTAHTQRACGVDESHASAQGSITPAAASHELVFAMLNLLASRSCLVVLDPCMRPLCTVFDFT